MPNDRAKQRFRGSIKEIEYTVQSHSVVEQLKIETAYGISKQQKKCWTTFKLGIPRPTLEHPLNVHFQAYNPNGDCLACMTIDEFDKLIDSITQWRKDHNEEILKLQSDDCILKRNKLHSDRVITLLSQHKYTEPPEIIIDGVNVTQVSIKREKEVILNSIINLKNTPNPTWLLADICKRLDDLVIQDIDISDLELELKKYMLTNNLQNTNIKNLPY